MTLVPILRTSPGQEQRIRWSYCTLRVRFPHSLHVPARARGDGTKSTIRRAHITRAELLTLLLVIVVLGNVVAASVAIVSGPPHHEARVELLVGDELMANPQPQYRNPQLVAGIAEVYARLATSPAVLQQALSRAGVDSAGEESIPRVRSSTTIGSPFFAVVVEASDPDVAAAVANEVAAILAASSESELPGPQTLSIIDPATPPPASSERLRLLLAGAAAGLAIAVAIAIRYLPRHRGVPPPDPSLARPDAWSTRSP
jgi:capsular polysaccharide biosynthesis protein